MDKLIAIKIKYDDGTYSDEIPIGALAENIEWNSSYSLVDILGEVAYDTKGSIQDQISQLFNEKVSASAMQDYVTNSMSTYITNWLNTNVNPVGSAVVVDSSLTVSGAAADAKVTGDKIGDLKADLNNLEDSQTIVKFNNTVSGTTFEEVPIFIPKGTYRVHVDKVTSGATGVNYSHVVFYNGSTQVGEISLSRDTVLDTNVTLSESATKINFYAGSNWSTSNGYAFEYTNFKIWTNTQLNVRITTIESDVQTIEDNLDEIVQPFAITETPGYYNSSGQVVSPTSNEEVCTNMLSVRTGDAVFWRFDTGQTSFSNMLWIAYMSYDADENVIGSRNQIGYATADKLSGILTIPDGVFYISFCYRTYGIDGFSASKYFVSTERIEKAISPYVFPFRNDKFYGHMFTYYVSTQSRDVEIPCQSIFDIQASSRLGFKYIEGNVHKTATTGKYVVTHGVSGKLGYDFENANGTAISTYPTIADTSYDDLRNNYRYRSKYPKYRVPITSLEEFLHECRTCNIYPLLQYVDETELDIARGIVGDNIILYAGNRSVFNGYIMEYLNYTTEAQILERCSSVGTPYMYCMANPSAFTDEQLRSIITKVHKMGCYIGSAGNYDGLIQTVRLINLGFDFSASGGMVNDFNDGNIINICDSPSFDGVTHNGTVVDGQLNLLQNQTLKFESEDVNFLKKYILDITFSGSFTVKYPTYVDGTENSYINIVSDGTQSQRISGVLVNRPLDITLWADEGGVTVKDVSFKMSKC